MGGRKKNDLLTNASGYSDPTAYQATVNVCKINDEKIHNILSDIFKVCKEHNVYIYGDIGIRSKDGKQGKVHLPYHAINYKNKKGE